MTFTRTMTLEELALDRLCSGEPVTINGSNDVVASVRGMITAITTAPSDSERPDLRYVTVKQQSGDVSYIIPLVHGAITF